MKNNHIYNVNDNNNNNNNNYDRVAPTNSQFTIKTQQIIFVVALYTYT